MQILTSDFLKSFFTFIWDTITSILTIPVLPGFTEGDFITRGELLFAFMLVSLAFSVVFLLFGFHPGGISSINETFKQREEKEKIKQYNNSKK